MTRLALKGARHDMFLMNAPFKLCKTRNFCLKFLSYFDSDEGCFQSEDHVVDDATDLKSIGRDKL